MIKDIPALINPKDSKALESLIFEDEIKKAIWTLYPDNAPRPDGFPICFYRMCWNLIKKDMVCIISWMSKGNMGGATKSTFISPIPKDTNPTSIKRLRTISLYNTSYTIFSKILSLRLNDIIPSLISPNQGGFINVCHISDDILLFQEAIHSSLKKRVAEMAIKLDLANAFDCLRHDFIFLILDKYGFALIFVKQIQACISSP